MARETKLGLGLMVLLVGVFGLVVYKKWNGRDPVQAVAAAEAKSIAPAVGGKEPPGPEADAAADPGDPFAASPPPGEFVPIKQAKRSAEPAVAAAEPSPFGDPAGFDGAPMATSEPLPPAAGDPFGASEPAMAAASPAADPFAPGPTAPAEPMTEPAMSATPAIDGSATAATAPTPDDPAGDPFAAAAPTMPAEPPVTAEPEVAAPPAASEPAFAAEPPATSEPTLSAAPEMTEPAFGATPPASAEPEVAAAPFAGAPSAAAMTPEPAFAAEPAPEPRLVADMPPAAEPGFASDPTPMSEASFAAAPTAKSETPFAAPEPTFGAMSEPEVAAAAPAEPPVAEPSVEQPPATFVPEASSAELAAAPAGEFGAADADGPMTVAGMTRPERTSDVPSGTSDYVVATANDSFWTISKRAYGTPLYFHALARYNAGRIPRADQLRPGMTVLTPPAAELAARYPDLSPTGGGTVAAPESSGPPGFLIDGDGRPSYRVGASDTLSDIALAHLGRSSRWVQIYEMNRDVIPDAKSLRPGVVLRLPADASRVRLVPEG